MSYRWEKYYNNQNEALLDYANRQARGQGVGMIEFKKHFGALLQPAVLEDLAKAGKLRKENNLYYSLNQPTLEDIIKSRFMGIYDNIDKHEIAQTLKITVTQVMKVLDKLVADNVIEVNPWQPSTYRIKINKEL